MLKIRRIGSKDSPETGFEILDEIWFEILARVPTDLVVHLRCLSKFHRDLINSPAFIRKHSDQSNETPTYFITPSTNRPNPNSRYYKEGLMKDYFVKKFDPTSSNSDTPVVHRLIPPHKSYKCVGSCKGIILLRSPENIMLWNPLTGASRTFPKVNGRYLSETFILGHDQTTDDLKIVKIMHTTKYVHIENETFNEKRDDPSGKYESEIYSSKSNSWRRKILEADHSIRVANHIGVFVEGSNSLHMIGEDEDNTIFIVAFDFLTEKFSRIRPPEGCEMIIGTGIWSLDGCLSVYTTKPTCNMCLRVWMMREYGNDESWDLVMKFDFSPWTSYCNLKPLQFINGGRQCLFLSDQGVLFCDFDDEEVKLVSLERTDRSRFRFRPLGFEYTPSLRSI